MIFIRIGAGLFQLQNIGAVTPGFNARTDSYFVTVTAQGVKHRVTHTPLTERNTKDMIKKIVARIQVAINEAQV